MAEIHVDFVPVFYTKLTGTQSSFEKLIDDIEKDNSPIPGSRVGRFSSEPTNMTKKYGRKKLSSENASIERFRG